ncbi:MAG: aminotransferase class I/II-fold pyridoxal phosphate-dependent enzyme [Rhodoferax sp.]|uniref:aminotransferase class I/II-fold pyridoxal phosphate-dependent enzyme n=1 Tax=Rhodoferax sp. TaxID=50421 RepID=UPI0030162183
MNPRIHGGPDALGVPRFDFSTNSNACGPCPSALAAVQQADATRYPDASYTHLRAQLAQFHGVEAGRVVLAGSASEFIFRITAYVAQRLNGQTGQDQTGELSGRGQIQGRVCLPPHSYGDYAQAAQAWGLAVTRQADSAQLVWACEPSSPLGGAHALWPAELINAYQSEVQSGDSNSASQPETNRSERFKGAGQTPLVLDRAYETLRLSGQPSLTDDKLSQVWQLWTPNKALGLTGVRAAYVIAPLGAEETVTALERLCPSWPVGAHGVAMLQAWVQPEVHAWLASSLLTLRAWKTRQITLLQNLGWHCLPSDANFFCARPAPGCDLSTLRAKGINLRDTTSFGLPGHVRLGVLPPQAQDALEFELQKCDVPAIEAAQNQPEFSVPFKASRTTELA